MAFRTYANNDLVDVDQTDNVFDLKKKLKLSIKKIALSIDGISIKRFLVAL